MLGNELMGDDGFGPQVIRALEAAYEFEPRVVLYDLGTPGLDLFQGTVRGLWLEGEEIRGVVCRDGSALEGRRVVLTAGTFLRGGIHIGGGVREAAGRAGQIRLSPSSRK